MTTTAIKRTYASPEMIKVARDMYQTDETEIDDLDVRTSVEEGAGTWVAAWVWIPEEEYPAQESAPELTERTKAKEGKPCE